MEFSSYENIHDKNHGSSKRAVPEDDQQDAAITERPKDQPDSSADGQKVRKLRKQEAPTSPNASAEVNMEVAVTADDVMRAGGLGATDDISSILPVASDFTDFENHLHEVRGYEKSEGKIGEGQADLPKTVLEVGEDDVKDILNVEEHAAPEAVNMEAAVTSDEVIRAGGFGATDDISSFLPAAIDFTDFEQNLRDARDYENLDEKTNRPGLGWKE